MTTSETVAPHQSEQQLDRRGAMILIAVAAAAFVVVAAVLVPWSWVPGGQLTPMPASELFSAEELRRAEDFAQLRRWLGWSAYVVSLAVALALGLTPAGARLSRRVSGGLRWWLAVPVTVFVLLIIGRLATLPLTLWIRAQAVDYGLTHQSIFGWFTDQGRSLAVSTVTTSIGLLLLVGLARRRPRDWFLPGALAAVVLSFAGSFLYPVLVEPVFNRFTPMPNGPFKAAVLRLAAQEGLEVDQVLVADASRRTTTLNAYVSGLGGTRRVVVYDNLVNGLDRRQALSVVAHELAHAKNQDVLLGTTLGALGGTAGVGLLALLLDSRRLRFRADVSGPADPAVAALVLALVAVGGVLASPVTNTISRAIEARADRVAIDTTGDDAAFVGVQRRLAIEAIHDPTPPAWSQFWFGSHPTVLQRAGMPASLEQLGE